MTRNPYRTARPASLHDAGERLIAVIEASGESQNTWAREIYPNNPSAPISLGFIARPGSRPEARTLLRIDDICGGLFLDPPEREWAERRVATRRAR